MLNFSSLNKYAPGLALTLLIAFISISINKAYITINPVLFAVLIGIIIRKFLKGLNILAPGIKFATKNLLKLGIILLGSRLVFSDLIALGGSSLFIIVICIITAIIVTLTITRKFGISEKLGSLIAVGTAICGNSAIIATAPVIHAEEEEISFAVATITLFGLSAIIVYPVIGTLLQLTDLEFGTWVGVAINDTAQVVTAGYLFSQSAGETAIVIKLVRNIFIAPVIFIFSLKSLYYKIIHLM